MLFSVTGSPRLPWTKGRSFVFVMLETVGSWCCFYSSAYQS